MFVNSKSKIQHTFPLHQQNYYKQFCVKAAVYMYLSF